MTGTREADLVPKGEMHPIQVHLRRPTEPAVSDNVTRRAYEVYCEVWNEQHALVDLKGSGCRGGFTVGELLAFLYARSFPKDEWAKRYQEVITKGIM